MRQPHARLQMPPALTTLFTPRSPVLEGHRVIVPRQYAPSTSKEFIRFIATVERSVPAGTGDLPTPSTNYAACKHPQCWPGFENNEHPRWTFHFTPTSCSWLNAVEGFFSRNSARRYSSRRRRLSLGRRPLESAITRYIAATTTGTPSRFVWTATIKPVPGRTTLRIIQSSRSARAGKERRTSLPGSTFPW